MHEASIADRSLNDAHCLHLRSSDVAEEEMGVIDV